MDWGALGMSVLVAVGLMGLFVAPRVWERLREGRELWLYNGQYWVRVYRRRR